MKSNEEAELPETDPWWAKYWYASTIALCVWLLVAIYGAVQFDLELDHARVIVRESSENGSIGKPICQIELWLIVVLVPISLGIVNLCLALLLKRANHSD